VAVLGWGLGLFAFSFWCWTGLDAFFFLSCGVLNGFGV
jgi:hypothetical protein